MAGKFGAIGEAVEILQEEAEKGVSAAKQQVTGKGQNQPTQQGGQAQQPPSDQAGGQVPSESVPTNQPQDDQTQQFVQDLYGGTPNLTEGEIKEKELEDKKKQEELRQELHSQYYQGLVNRPRQGEERPAEKIEREEEEKKLQEQEEEEKKQKDELPVVVTKDMGTKEKLRGVSG